MENKIVVGNIKMNLISLMEKENYVKRLNKSIEENDFFGTHIIICPQSVHLENFTQNITQKENVFIGSQNTFWEDKGSFTGEISPALLSSMGVNYSIIGHSERREYFGETDEMINLKIKAAFRNNIDPIFCFGETREERDSGKTQEIIARQIKKALEGISRVDLLKVIFAYEPVWAIGGSTTPTSDEIMEIKILVRKILTDMKEFGEEYANKIKILYGGSVNRKNVEEVCTKPQMDGVLVGRESLVPYDFFEIIKQIENK